jgi:hypothetical protein
MLALVLQICLRKMLSLTNEFKWTQNKSWQALILMKFLVLTIHKYICTSGLADFSWYIIPKWGKIYQLSTKYTKCPYIIPTSCRILQYWPKLGFLSWKYTIWQPWCAYKFWFFVAPKYPVSAAQYSKTAMAHCMHLCTYYARSGDKVTKWTNWYLSFFSDKNVRVFLLLVTHFEPTCSHNLELLYFLRHKLQLSSALIAGYQTTWLDVTRRRVDNREENVTQNRPFCRGAHSSDIYHL